MSCFMNSEHVRIDERENSRRHHKKTTDLDGFSRFSALNATDFPKGISPRPFRSPVHQGPNDGWVSFGWDLHGPRQLWWRHWVCLPWYHSCKWLGAEWSGKSLTSEHLSSFIYPKTFKSLHYCIYMHLSSFIYPKNFQDLSSLMPSGWKTKNLWKVFSCFLLESIFLWRRCFRRRCIRMNTVSIKFFFASNNE